jgi:hypothetical protein
MTDEAKTIQLFAPISIRYEGIDADRHEIELGPLGESLQGFAKTIAVTANFAATGRLAVHADALDVRVIARPVDEHHCFEVVAFVSGLVQSKEFWSGMGPGVFAASVQYVLSKRSKEEMKHLSEALNKSLDGNQETTNRLVATIEKMAEALTASARKALAPIGRTCDRIDLLAGNDTVASMDIETKQAFSAAGSRVADHSKTFRGVITAFNIATGTCEVLLEGGDRPVSGRVLDPVFDQPNNPYALALASKASIAFLAKYEADSDGRVTRLHIFDTAEE